MLPDSALRLDQGFRGLCDASSSVYISSLLCSSDGLFTDESSLGLSVASMSSGCFSVTCRAVFRLCFLLLMYK